jgi:hypothetical protein
LWDGDLRLLEGGELKSTISQARKPGMSRSGQEERFPPIKPDAGYGFRKETIAWTQGNKRDA